MTTSDTKHPWNNHAANRGEGAFKPKRAKDEDALQERINAVVKKAKAREVSQKPGTTYGVDVIRFVRERGGRFRGVRARKF